MTLTPLSCQAVSKLSAHTGALRLRSGSIIELDMLQCENRTVFKRRPCYGFEISVFYRDNITSKRNIHEEEVSRHLMNPCKYAKQVCRVYKHPDKIREHDIVCQQQPMGCLAGYGRQHLARCGWTGRKFWVTGHVCEQRGLTVIHVRHSALLNTPLDK